MFSYVLHSGAVPKKLQELVLSFMVCVSIKPYQIGNDFLKYAISSPHTHTHTHMHTRTHTHTHTQ